MEYRFSSVVRVVVGLFAVVAMSVVARDLQAGSLRDCPFDPPHLLGECFDCQSKCESYWGENALYQCYGSENECCGCPQR